jgi:chemotaxis protein CheD
MQQTIEVGTADFAIAKAPVVLESQGIGSCVVTCLYDNTKKIGALCHIMLPKQVENSTLNPRRFADTALPLVFADLERLGCRRSQLVAHLVGGASMFQHVGAFINTIGEQNIAAVKHIMADQDIRIVGLDIGGKTGRNVTFYLDSGKVIATSRM